MSAEARIFRIEQLDCRVEAYDWPFVREQAARIGAHWSALVAQKPALFDGRVLLSRNVRITEEGGGLLRAAHFETSFSSFMAWRDFGFPDAEVCNSFAMAALRSSDGAFLLGEMAAHTANAGMVYFPAGTPDRSDVKDGFVDLAGSVARELREETGIGIEEAEIDPVWTVVALGPRVACMRPVTLVASADEVVARVEAALAQEETPELAGLRPVRSMRELAGMRTPEFLRKYLEFAFERM